MKRYLVLAAMILLAGVVYLYEEKPPAETRPSRLSSPELTYEKMDVPQVTTNSHFLDNINLTYEPMVVIRDPEAQPTSLPYGKDLPSAPLGKIRPRPVDTAAPAFTVADRKLNYELLGSEGFSVKLNLAPAYPNPQALIPTRLDPGVGVSIKF
jgi:hypothetical protein